VAATEESASETGSAEGSGEATDEGAPPTEEAEEDISLEAILQDLKRREGRSE
jgi:hypothetical protein